MFNEKARLPAQDAEWVHSLMNQETKDLFELVKKQRSDIKKKILMTGLLQKIKCELWPRITPSDRYEEMCELAYIAENIVIYKQLSEPNL